MSHLTMRTCAAGRELIKDGDPFWTEPCPEPGNDILVIDDPGSPDYAQLFLCRAHMEQVPVTADFDDVNWN